MRVASVSHVSISPFVHTDRKTPRSYLPVLASPVSMSSPYILHLANGREGEKTRRRGRSPCRDDQAPRHRERSTIQKIRAWTPELMPSTLGSSRFKLPIQFGVYDRKTDPMDHLDLYKNMMTLQGYSNEVMCKAFSATLKGLGQAEECLPPIHSPPEGWRELERLHQAVLEVEDASDKVVVMAMMEGLRAEELAEAKHRRRGRDDHKRNELDSRRADYKDEVKSKRSD
ncbi:hypothetical protein Acr_26g0008390 [Actinidia rufa]|uniref:Uncharacterized protein n=1 Tax=Actinidia rufa TaxID=165716 RepID=A0A7J0H3E2_9ERIC|nr:hypothetical protein Acr_26g0008390 [Actinidia rufa]